MQSAEGGRRHRYVRHYARQLAVAARIALLLLRTKEQRYLLHNPILAEVARVNREARVSRQMGKIKRYEWKNGERVRELSGAISRGNKKKKKCIYMCT